MHSTVYFLLRAGFIDDVDHGTTARGTAKITCLDSGFAMSGSELSLGSGTDTKEADESKAEWPSGSETGLIPAPYSFEPSGTESDSSAATSSDDSEQNRLSDLSW